MYSILYSCYLILSKQYLLFYFRKLLSNDSIIFTDFIMEILFILVKEINYQWRKVSI